MLLINTYFNSKNIDFVLVKKGNRDIHFQICFSFSEYNVAIFITNQMTADPGATMSYVQNQSDKLSASSIMFVCMCIL